jgi:hypothetical protein
MYFNCQKLEMNYLRARFVTALRFSSFLHPALMMTSDDADQELRPQCWSLQVTVVD